MRKKKLYCITCEGKHKIKMELTKKEYKFLKKLVETPIPYTIGPQYWPIEIEKIK